MMFKGYNHGVITSMRIINIYIYSPYNYSYNYGYIFTSNRNCTPKYGMFK